jgi:hypothetical protein
MHMHLQELGGFEMESGPVVVATSELPDARWRRSRASNATGNCVEVVGLPGGAVAVRHSRSPAGPALVYTREEMAAFVEGVRAGEFDDLVAES